MRGFSRSPERLTGVGSSLGRVRLGGLGCGKSLWDSPGRDPGVGGATSTTSGSSMEGPPGSMAAAGSMGGALSAPLGVTQSSPCGPAATWSPAAWGGDCFAWLGADGGDAVSDDDEDDDEDDEDDKTLTSPADGTHCLACISCTCSCFHTRRRGAPTQAYLGSLQDVGLVNA